MSSVGWNSAFGVADMISRIVDVRPLQGYRQWVHFHVGQVGTIELIHALWGPMIERL